MNPCEFEKVVGKRISKFGKFSAVQVLTVVYRGQTTFSEEIHGLSPIHSPIHATYSQL